MPLLTGISLTLHPGRRACRSNIKMKMTDTLSKTERSKAMSKVRSSDTKPEWILRSGLHRLGFRYRLRDNRLPGRPDLVFPKYRAVVFVHGCFWHRHAGCKDASMPQSNVSFWAAKFATNLERDRRSKRQIEHLGWRALVVWECELTKHTVETIRKVADWLGQDSGSDKDSSYNDCVVDRCELLAIAEQRVRYRIASYDKKVGLTDSGTTEAQEP